MLMLLRLWASGHGMAELATQSLYKSNSMYSLGDMAQRTRQGAQISAERNQSNLWEARGILPRYYLRRSDEELMSRR